MENAGVRGNADNSQKGNSRVGDRRLAGRRTSHLAGVSEGEVVGPIRGQVDLFRVAVDIDRNGAVRASAGLQLGKDSLGNNSGIRFQHAVFGRIEGDGEHSHYGHNGKGYDTDGHEDLDKRKGLNAPAWRWLGGRRSHQRELISSVFRPV